MPSAPHDILVAAFHEQPSLLAAALERLTHTRTRGRLRIADSVRRIVREVEVRPDNGFEGDDPPWTVVEVQNEIDLAKPRRWTLLPMRPAVRQFLRDMEAIGEARGKAIGEAKGKQDALLTLLATRGLAVTATNRARIKACDKTATLDRWIARAATAAARQRPQARKKAVARR
jgi:hypothetical protein